MSDPRAVPTPPEVEELLECCRYGELHDVEAFVEKFGWEAIVSAKDERGNSVLHMCCGNGHLDVLTYLLPHLPPSLLQETNEAGSPPLHWAILNNHTSVVQKLVEVSPKQGGGLPLLKQANRAGRDAFAEALWGGEGKEEVAGWIEGYLWKAEGGEEEPDREVASEGTEEVVVKTGEEPSTPSEAPSRDMEGLAEETKKVELN